MIFANRLQHLPLVDPMRLIAEIHLRGMYNLKPQIERVIPLRHTVGSRNPREHCDQTNDSAFGRREEVFGCVPDPLCESTILRKVGKTLKGGRCCSNLPCTR